MDSWEAFAFVINSCSVAEAGSSIEPRDGQRF